MSESVKAVLYAAKSTADPKGSIPTQLADGHELSERAGWDVAAEYHDEAESAYHGNRGDGLEKARAHAEQLVSEGYEVKLVVQHTDRLARGDAVHARHLIEHVLWALQSKVQIVSKQDPLDFNRPDWLLIEGALKGTRHHEDSSRKGAAITDGHQRAVERGEWKGGVLPSGYAMNRTVDDHGKVTREIVKHPEDEAHYDLIWRLAEGGASMQRISMELGRRGAMTRPIRTEVTKGKRAGTKYEAKPFTTGRVQQVLNNPFYAGYQMRNGERFPGPWPTYVDIETFERLKRKRDERAGNVQRGRGRPRKGYLLSELATCATCGGRMQGVSPGRERVKKYVCSSHREYPPGHDRHCPSRHINAARADKLILSRLDLLLQDAGTLREQMAAGQRAEREKLARIVEQAQEEARVAEVAAERAEAIYADKLAEADDAELSILMNATKRKRVEAEAARARMDAALDALNADDPELDYTNVMERLWESLTDALTDAGDDVKVLNAVLREHFDRFELDLDENGSLLAKPILSAAGVAQAAREVCERTGYTATAPPPTLLVGSGTDLELPAFSYTINPDDLNDG
jgi:DNA invertase Pin-like site-specific DNA recombinase